MAVARGFRNSSSCGVENKLKVIKLTARKIEKETNKQEFSFRLIEREEVC